MLYKSFEDVRVRSNQIGYSLNEATHYGRRPLPPEFADLDREWNELAAIYQNPAKYPALFKGGAKPDPFDCRFAVFGG